MTETRHCEAQSLSCLRLWMAREVFYFNLLSNPYTRTNYILGKSGKERR